MTRRAVEPTHFPFFDYKGYSFSLGLETPTGVWLSGHTASRYAPELKRMIVAGEGDLVGQARQIYQNTERLLHQAGLGWEHVVKTVAFITPAALPRYRETAAVRRAFFQAPLPAATGIVCAALLRPEMLIEVDAWAVV